MDQWEDGTLARDRFPSPELGWKGRRVCTIVLAARTRQADGSQAAGASGFHGQTNITSIAGRTQCHEHVTGSAKREGELGENEAQGPRRYKMRCSGRETRQRNGGEGALKMTGHVGRQLLPGLRREQLDRSP